MLRVSLAISLIVAGLAALVGVSLTSRPAVVPDHTTERGLPPHPVHEVQGMVFIPAGRVASFPAPAVSSTVEISITRFWLDTYAVTNAEFARFVRATGYRTTAELRGSSLVFDRHSLRWQELTDATWRAPLGPRSSLAGRERHPVVHVSWYDAAAYAEWVGKRLPTPAEHQWAASGGVRDTLYPWGNKVAPAGHPAANFWQGEFPQRDLGLDGHTQLAAVGRFTANRFGLRDIAGNAWCWCADAGETEPVGGRAIENSSPPRRVLRGGSYLTTAGDLAVTASTTASAELTSCDVGFRCAADTPPVPPLAARPAAASSTDF